VQYVSDRGALAVDALAALGLTRGGLHERAVANLKRALPPGFAPGDHPAVLDDESGVIVLALPDAVPPLEAWIAYPLRGEGLVVMREGASTTRDELLRLARAHKEDPKPVFASPVRVSKRGFMPFDWPDEKRTTDPGFASPDAKIAGEPGDER
jgi:hypothetical protein